MNVHHYRKAASRIGASAIAAAITAICASAPAQAADTYWSGGGVGRHADATVICANSPYEDLTARPNMGTTPGYEWGQNVAWKYTITNAVTGRQVWRDAYWRTQRIATSKYLYVLGNYAGIETNQHADLPDARWNMAPGQYRVFIDYAWLTSAGWSYAQSRTDSYLNLFSFLGTYQGTYGPTCRINK